MWRICLFLGSAFMAGALVMGCAGFTVDRCGDVYWTGLSGKSARECSDGFARLKLLREHD